MVPILLLSLAAFLVAILTFFSGFGLGTILTPVFMLFFPADLAIALTGVVHFFNNLFKLGLAGRYADRNVVLRFGLPAVLAALTGAWLLLRLSGLKPLYSYMLDGRIIDIYLVKLIIALLLILFAGMELLPFFQRLQFRRKWLPLGGVLSGFFGGLSGNQGALRSAFLIKAGLSKEAFIGTAVVVSTLVDFTRLGVYATRFAQANLEKELPLVASATLAGILGAYIGNTLLKKVTLRFLQKTVAIMLLVLALALAAGIV